jgi:hypothetical protein
MRRLLVIASGNTGINVRKQGKQEERKQQKTAAAKTGKQGQENRDSLENSENRDSLICAIFQSNGKRPG